MNAPLDAGQRASLEAALSSVTLDDKYTLERGRAYMSGIQALVRLPMLQQERDQAAGLNTAGFISGYRGSPLGGLDQSLWKAKTASRRAPRRVPARRQRGPRGDRRVGLAAGQSVPERQIRWRVRHVVRQGPGRRPLRRRLQARQLGGLVAARRRAGAGRRRPRRQVLDARAPVRTHLQGVRPAGAVPVERAGIPRLRPARLGDEPLFRPLGGDEVRDRRGRIVGLGRYRSAPHRDHPARRLRDARGRPEHPLARSAAGAGSASARLQVVRGARLRAREQARPHRDRCRRTRASAS